MAVFRLLRLLYLFVSLWNLFFNFLYINFRNLLFFMLNLLRCLYLILTLDWWFVFSNFSKLLIRLFSMSRWCPFNLIIIWSIRLFIVNTYTTFFFNIRQWVYSYQIALLLVINYWNSRFSIQFIIQWYLFSIVKLI